MRSVFKSLLLTLLKIMKNIHFILFFFLVFFGNQYLLAQKANTTSIPYFLKNYQTEYKDSPRKAALDWFEDARLGMFIHWGVWGKYHAAWAMYNNQIPLDEYRKTAREVDASGFNVLEIVKLAEESGMRYITFVAKHHDGFCLWDSKYTDFDSKDYPTNRDFLAELAEVCHQRGMPLNIYYSLGIDWTHPWFIGPELYKMARPDYAIKPDYFKYQNSEDFEKYREFCKNQLTELCTQYGPVAGFWFDPLGGVLANSEMFNVQEFYDLIHQYQPHALIHFKTGITGTEDVLVGERELKSISMHYPGTTEQDRIIRELSDKAWNRNMTKKAEIAVTSQKSWEWNPEYKCADVDELWKMLVGASENNANLLLNFGPKPDGSIPEDVAVNFRLLGEKIRLEGYPTLNKTTWPELRKKGVDIDKTEINKTAR
jgi:alpha-L-fucosidase